MGTTALTADTTHLANQDYTICFRRYGSCARNCYAPRAATGTAAAIDQEAFGLSISAAAASHRLEPVAHPTTFRFPRVLRAPFLLLEATTPGSVDGSSTPAQNRLPALLSAPPSCPSGSRSTSILERRSPLQIMPSPTRCTPSLEASSGSGWPSHSRLLLEQAALNFSQYLSLNRL